MQTVSNSYKEYLNTSLSISPKSKIVVDGVAYEGDVIKTSPKISHSNSSFIGGFTAKTVSFDIYNLNNNLDFENKEITVYKGLVINGTIEWVKQGIFIPQAKDITNNVSTKVMTISNAQDRTQLLDDKYESSLDWTNNTTHTGLEIVQEICTKKNLTLETTDFAWANYSFKQPNFSETITNREVISRLAEIGGEVGLFGCNGGIQIKGQYTTGDTIQRKRYEKLSKENTYTVNTVVLGKKGIDDDIVYPETITTDRVEFRIEDNPFVDLYRQEMIETVANYVIGKSYTPFKLDGFVDGFIYELNDVLSVVDRNGDTFNAVILDYSSSSRIKATIKAETQDKKTTNYNLAGSKQQAINEVKLQVDYINNTVTALSSKVEDLTDYLREVTGTSSITLNDTVESDGAIGKLSISGFTEMLLYPNMVYPSSKVYPSKLTTYIIVQTNGTSTYETYIDLGKVLSSTDELIIENNKVYVKSGSTTTDMNIPVLLKTFKGATTINVKYFNNVSISCSYIAENELTKVFATQAEVSAQWKITNESINSKVTKAEVISEINQSAEAVKIASEKLDVDAIATFTNNKLKDAGSTEINGENITTGNIKSSNYVPNESGMKIDLENGKIDSKNFKTDIEGNVYLGTGGKVIGGDGLLTTMTIESSIKSRSFIGGSIMLPMGYSLHGKEQDNSLIVSKDSLMFEFVIPKGFHVKSAFIIIQHIPVYYRYEGTPEYTGNSRNLNVYKAYSFDSGKAIFDAGYYNLDFEGVYCNKIDGAFGQNGFTGSRDNYTKMKSIDIGSYIERSDTEDKFNILKIETGNDLPTTETEIYNQSGSCKATLIIQGYTSFE